MLLVPAAAIAGFRLPRRWATGLGAFLLAVGLLGTAAYLAYDLWAFLAAAPAEAREVVVNRVQFAAMNQTDVPLLPAVVAGPAAWAGAWWAERRGPAPDSVAPGSPGG